MARDSAHAGGDGTVARDAAGWHARMNDPSATEEDAKRFAAWLAADPAHSDAYRRIAGIWADALPAAQRLGASGWHRRPSQRATLRPGWGRRLGAMAACLLLLVATAAWWREPGLLTRLRADHATSRGEQRTILLAEGIRMLLDADSAVQVFAGDDSLQTRLLRGRAWFEITGHDGPALVVRAGAVRLRDIGTAFAVELSGDAVLVTVEQGAVAVAVDEASQEATLRAGERQRITGHRRGAVERIDPAKLLAWRRGVLVFDRAPLAAVVAELDRMAPGRIVLTDSSLGGMRLSGVFRIDDQEAIIAALTDGLGLHITRLPGLLTVIRR